ncbi:Zinc knuckle family protein [Aphelenchoides avenae]|nr:Zinc knuckle family protein [Aphelenchus avenae]
MAAAFQYLLLNWINSSTAIRSKTYKTTVDDSEPAQGELKRLVQLEIQLAQDRDQLQKCYDNITAISVRWSDQISNLTLGTPESTEAADTFAAFDTEQGLQTTIAAIASKLTAMARSLEEASASIDAVSANCKDISSAGMTRGNPQSAAARHTSFTFLGDEDDAHNMAVMDDSTTNPLGLAGSNPFYTSSSSMRGTRSPRHLLQRSAAASNPIQLRELPLKPFEGDILEWITFRERFLRVIEAPGRNLEDADKLAYLINYLRGEPATLISRMPITDLNYHKATALLQQRYGRPDLVEIRLQHELQHLKPCTMAATDLRRFTDEVMQLCSQLKQIRVDPNQSTIRHIIELKLQPNLRAHVFSQRHLFEEWNTQAILDVLQEKARLEEEVAAFHDGSSGKPYGRQSSLATPVAAPPSRSFAARTTDRSTCVFCRSTDHWPTSCPNVASNDARWAYVMKHRLCFQCLRSGHLISDCPKRERRCRVCKQQHHVALCQKGDPKRSVGNTQGNPSYAAYAESDGDAADQPPSDVESEPEEVSTSSFTSSTDSRFLHSSVQGTKEMVYLPEARKATVKNPETGNTKNITVFFDSGCSQSFVSTKLLEDLDLQRLSKTVLSFRTFGNPKPVKLPGTRTNIAVSTENGDDIQLDVWALPELVGKMPVAHIDPKDTYRHELYGYEPEYRGLVMETPDLVIGANYQHRFEKRITNKRAVGDFYVVHSTLGPMIAGHGFVEPFSRFPDPDNVHSVHFASNNEGSPTLPSPPGGPDDCCQSSGSSTLANAGGLTPNPLANAGGRHQPAFTFKDYLRWRETPSTPGTPLDITKD